MLKLSWLPLTKTINFFNKQFPFVAFSEAIPISYVVPVSSIPMANSGLLSHGANSPRAADGRSVTSEDTRSDSGKSEEDGELYDATSPALPENTAPSVHQIIRVRMEELHISACLFFSVYFLVCLMLLFIHINRSNQYLSSGNHYLTITCDQYIWKGPGRNIPGPSCIKLLMLDITANIRHSAQSELIF